MTTPTQPSLTRPRPSQAPIPPRPVDASLSRAGRASQALTGRGSGTTPRRLRLLRLVHVALALALGLGAVVTATELEQREATAAVHTVQYGRATQLETSLQTAQATAGDTPASGAVLPEKTQDALDEVTTLLVDMAAERTDDPATLADLGQQVTRYTVALAAGKTAQAKQILTDTLLPAVKALQQAHGEVTATVVSWWMWLLPVVAWLTVAFIVGTGWYTARVSHRLVNPGLLTATIATAILAGSSGSLMTAHLAGPTNDPGYLALAVGCALASAAAGAWGLHQRLKEYR